MADPITIGTVAVSALAVAGEAIVKGTVGEVVKDAYTKLKALIRKQAPKEVESLDAKPESEARRAVVVEILDALPESQIAELDKQAQRLVEVLEREAARQPIGIDLTRLTAMNMHFRRVKVTSGTGILAREVDLKGDFNVGSLEVGSQTPGKPPR